MCIAANVKVLKTEMKADGCFVMVQQVDNEVGPAVCYWLPCYLCYLVVGCSKCSSSFAGSNVQQTVHSSLHDS